MKHIHKFESFLGESSTVDLSKLYDELLLQIIDILNNSSVDFKKPENQKALMSLAKEKEKRGI